MRHGGGDRTVGRLLLGGVLPPDVDAALAFDAVYNPLSDLHPTGLVHGLRGLTYRLSQRWRGVTPAPPNPAAVARASEHH